MAKLSAKTTEKIRALKDNFPQRRSAVLPALHYAQAELGHLDDATLLEVAGILEVPRNMTAEVVGFYTMFEREKTGQYKIEVCRNLSCALKGANRLTRHLAGKLGVAVGETTPDGKFTLTEAECLGACGYAPMMAIGPYFYENLTRETADAIIDALAAGKEPPVRPAGFLDLDDPPAPERGAHAALPAASEAIGSHLAVRPPRNGNGSAPALPPPLEPQAVEQEEGQ